MLRPNLSRIIGLPTLTILCFAGAATLLQGQEEQKPKKYPTGADAGANALMTIPEYVAHHGSYSMGGVETYVYYGTFDELLRASEFVIQGQLVF